MNAVLITFVLNNNNMSETIHMCSFHSSSKKIIKITCMKQVITKRIPRPFNSPVI